ncbi:MAG: AGE family epimerase/isomerase [Acidobacteriota bacterium]|nr:AGE family epimerase/isomerase [Acidobacteriota bacterium]
MNILKRAVICLFAFFPALASGADSAMPQAMEAEYWKRQALEDLIPHWLESARDIEHGAFFMNLSRDWKPLPPWDKVPALISRHVFGFSAAYLLSGDEKYLEVARDAADYLLAHAWDGKYGGWFDKLARNGEAAAETKSISLQLYTNVGLTAYYFATGDERVLSHVLKSVAIQRSRGRDDVSGGYAQVLNRDLSVLDYGKNKHAHYGYVGSLLLNLYLATRDPGILAWEKELMDLSLERMKDSEGWLHGFRNRFDREWKLTPNPVDGREVFSVGADLTGALALLRLYHQSGDKKYLESGRILGDRLIRRGFDPEKGAWPDLVETKAPFRVVADPTIWWWIQIYGSFLQLQLYDVTGEPSYLENFRKSEEFFERFFIDHEKGGVYAGLDIDGRVKGESHKGSVFGWHTSYHEMEHALLNYLYLNLYVHRKPAVLHFKLDGPADHCVSFVDDPAVRISSVTMDGRPWATFDAAARSVSVPSGKGHSVRVTLAPGPSPKR